MNSSKARYFLEVALVVFVMILQLIWPLPGTIALRNMCLIGGAISSLLLIFFFQEKIKSNIPTFLLLLVPVWLLAHYFLIPIDLEKQWYDLSGTWLRVIFGILIALSLGRLLVQKSHWAKWIFFPYLLLALGMFILFCKDAILQHHWVVLNFVGLFKAKISVTYFSFFTCLITCGLLASSKNNVSSKSNAAYLLIVTLCFVNCINAQSLIGFLFCASACIVAGCIFLSKSIDFKNKLYWRVPSLLMLVTLCAILTFYQYDKHYEGKLSHLKSDIVLSYDIDKNTTWTRSDNVTGIPDPIDKTGRTINGSTYERVSWLHKGTRVLRENPLGTGYSWAAFHRYMELEYPGSTVYKTHSGWLDFAIGVGLPGLFLTWSAIMLIVRQAFLNLKKTDPDKNSYIVIFVLPGMSFMWFVAEVCEREFIEHFFFFIALSASYLYAFQQQPAKNAALN